MKTLLFSDFLKIDGRRDFADGLIMRSIGMRLADEQPKEENRIRVIASSDEMYDWGYYCEKLVHSKEAVNVSGAVSALFNHDRNQVIGGIVSTSIESGKMTADLEIDPEARGSNGLKILNAIKKGYIRGVSIGYGYLRQDCEIKQDENGKMFITANRWTLREISITPTPADLSAQVVRNQAESFVRAFAAPAKKGVQDMNFDAWLAAKGFKRSDLSQQQLDEMKRLYETETRAVDSHTDELKKARDAAEAAKRDAETSKREAEEAKLVAKLGDLARSHNVTITAEELKGKTEADGLRMILERKAEADKKINPQSGVATDIQVTRDVADKVDAAAEDGLFSLAGMKNEKDLGMRGGGVLDIGRRWLFAAGVRKVIDMTRYELAQMLLGNGGRMNRFDRISGKRDAANVTSGMYTTYLLANVMDKAIAKGFADYLKNVTYPIWTGRRQVSDFKAFTGAALDVGNLVETTENIAFPELVKGEAGYSSQLGMWGATMSLTLQALINDDLGEFMNALGRAGSIAQRTIDKEVYTALAAATWTSRTTTGDLSDANVSKLRDLLSRVAGPSGEVIGTVPKYLIVPSGLRSKALEITQVSPSLVMNDAIKVNTDVLPVITPYLATAGTPAESTYYLAGDQSIIDTLIVAMLNGMEAPVVEEYDPGAVAARKWKVMLPFKAFVPTTHYGLYQGTHA